MAMTITGEVDIDEVMIILLPPGPSSSESSLPFPLTRCELIPSLGLLHRGEDRGGCKGGRTEKDREGGRFELDHIDSVGSE